MLNPIAVSSWALHKTIGVTYHDSPSAGAQEENRHSSLVVPLLELPALLAQHGYSALQLCHFHLPSCEPAYLQSLRLALADAGVSLHALLIDEGDISDPVNGDRDAEWIAGWLRPAELLGAQHARVIGGKQTYSREAADRSIGALRQLVSGSTVRVEIENWHDLTSTPAAVIEILDALDGQLGLCADFGNWPKPRKYDDLPLILPRAETCHAKLEFVSPAELDLDDASACLGFARDAGFAGTFVLVNGGMGGSEWDALAIQRDAIVAF